MYTSFKKTIVVRFRVSYLKLRINEYSANIPLSLYRNKSEHHYIRSSFKANILDYLSFSKVLINPIQKNSRFYRLSALHLFSYPLLIRAVKLHALH